MKERGRAIVHQTSLGKLFLRQLATLLRDGLHCMHVGFFERLYKDHTVQKSPEVAWGELTHQFLSVMRVLGVK